MFARLFRLADRIGLLVVKVSLWLSEQLVIWSRTISNRVEQRMSRSSANTASERIESLSSLTVILLAVVLILIFWATSARAQGSITIPIPAIGPTSAAEADDAEESIAIQPTIVPEVQAIETTGTIVFSMYAGNQQDLFALSGGQFAPVRLTDHPADDRDPVWSPDGQNIAFASNRDGNWDLYLLNIPTGDVSRLTNDPAFEAGPTWSPDGQWIAYEGYYDGNLDIFLVRADRSEGPFPVTRQPGPDFDPAWTTAEPGREIAYVSVRDDVQDIYLMSLDNPSDDLARNLTQTANVAEHSPAWSATGDRIAYSANAEGFSLIYTLQTASTVAQPVIVGQGFEPTWSVDGSRLVFLADRADELTGTLLLTGQFGAWEASVQAFALSTLASDPHWSEASLPDILQGSLAFAMTADMPVAYTESLQPRISEDELFRLIDLANYAGVIADLPYMSDRVDESFLALREHVNRSAGWDFLGRLDSVLWNLDHPVAPGENPRNWHKAGRAFDVIQTYNDGSPAQVELIPERIGPDTFWRLYVRAAIQDGSLGEPLRATPWDFNARTSGDARAYEDGGRFRDSIPNGYYIDFTELARLYGWERTPSDSTWRYNWPGVSYWQYHKGEGLDWWEAMLELYPNATLQESFLTPTPRPRIDVTIAPLPTVVETPSSDDEPEVTPSPTPTVTPDVEVK